MKGTKGAKKVKIEPEREREHGFAGVPESTRSARRSSCGHAEITCRLFGQQRGTKGAQKGKIEPDCESEHGFASTSGHSEGTWSPLGVLLEALGGHLEPTWRPLGL